MASSMAQSTSALLTYLRPYCWHAGVACGAAWILLRWLRTYCHRFRTTRLRGPPSESIIYGVGKRVLDINGFGSVYEEWAQEYGPVYTIPSALGGKKIILCDPKAVTHFYSKETWTYIEDPFTKKALEIVFGRGLVWAHGEDHKRHVDRRFPTGNYLTNFTRQRKSLAPAFTIPAIRESTSIFYDSAYKTKGAWDALIQSSSGDSAIIDVENWTNRITLDTIGLAAFSHDFGALQGKHANVTEVFDTFSTSPHSSALNTGLFLWGQMFPFLIHVPTSRGTLIRKLSAAMADISRELLTRARKEMEVGVIEVKELKERSIIGCLIKGVNGESESHLTEEEAIAQMKFVLLAGYETTSVSLSWALVELSRNPDMQTRLRNEILEHGADPTYDELSHGLPYLDAVVHETLRVHTPVVETTRIAVEDDIIPLSEPIRTKSGELVDSLTIAKGTHITVPMESLNRSAALWGEDAKEFRPSRWLEDAHSGENGIPAKAKEIRGYRHLLTFSDGPKMCQGKHFAVTTFKSVLVVLVKNFTFELPGVDTEIKIETGITFRPKIAGEVGCKLPLRVRPYVA